MRLFCAVPLSDELRAEIRRVSAPLRALGADVRWVPEENVHLTLAFLGDTNRAVDAREAVEAAARESAPFQASFGPYGAFPSPEEPKVIWLGLSLGEPELSTLAAAVRGELLVRGLPLDDKPFVAHATLGRVKRPGGLKPLKEALVERSPNLHKPFTVEQVALFESKNTPAGPEYTVVARARLAGR